MKLYRQAHVVYKTQYHLLWVTRYRRNILVPGVAEYGKTVLRAVREFHPDWFLEEIGVERPCPSAQGDSVEIRGLTGGEDLEKRNRSAAEREIPARVEQSVLGWQRGLGTRIVRLHGGINEATIRQYVRHQGEQQTAPAQLEW